MEFCIFQSIIHIFLPCVFHAAVVNSFLTSTDTYELLRCKATFAICKHLKSADLLCKSLLSHVWRVPGSKGFSCKHERLFELLTLVSSNKHFRCRKSKYVLWSDEKGSRWKSCTNPSL